MGDEERDEARYERLRAIGVFLEGEGADDEVAVEAAGGAVAARSAD